MANHAASTSQLPEFWTRNQNITKIMSMSSETILTRKCEMNVYANILQSLQPPNWLNDDAIVLYMKLIANEVIVTLHSVEIVKKMRQPSETMLITGRPPIGKNCI